MNDLIAHSILVISVISIVYSLPVHRKDDSLNTLLTKILPDRQRNNKQHCQLERYVRDIGLGYGCKSQNITNYACRGQCSSIFVPSHRSGHIVCSRCKAKSKKYVHVTLDCPKEQRVVVEPITNECSCQPCLFNINSALAVSPRRRKKRRKNKRKEQKRKNKKIKNEYDNLVEEYRKDLKQKKGHVTKEIDKLKRKKRKRRNKRKQNKKRNKNKNRYKNRNISLKTNKTDKRYISYLDLIHSMSNFLSGVKS